MDMDTKDVLEYLRMALLSIGAEITSPWFYFQVGVVVAGPAQDPHDSVLPTAPRPAPTVTVTVTPTAPAQPATSGGTTTGG